MNEDNLQEENLQKSNLQEENQPMNTEPRDVEKEWAEELHFDSWPPKQQTEQQEMPQTPPPFTGEVEGTESVDSMTSETAAPQPLKTPEPYIAPQSPQSSSLSNAGFTEPMPDTYLVWSVLATVLCCLIPGIVAIIYSSKVSSRYYAKDYEGAKQASKMAQYWIIGSIVVGIVVQTLYLPMMMAL